MYLTRLSGNRNQAFGNPAIPAIGLGIAAFQLGRSLVFSGGGVQVQANALRYVHENTPLNKPFTQFRGSFLITAHHPRYGLDQQKFWFGLNFEYNGNDLRSVAVTFLENKSSALTASDFSISFQGNPYSLPNDPVAEIEYSISGRWDPVGLGVDSFQGYLRVNAKGSVVLRVTSEQGWVKNSNSFYSVSRRLLSAPELPTQPPPLNRPQEPHKPSTTSRPILRIRARGSWVQNLQGKLNNWLRRNGRALIHADGVFGSQTKSTVKSFQRANHLTADGVVGPATWQKLDSV